MDTIKEFSFYQDALMFSECPHRDKKHRFTIAGTLGNSRYVCQLCGLIVLRELDEFSKIFFEKSGSKECLRLPN